MLAVTLIMKDVGGERQRKDVRQHSVLSFWTCESFGELLFPTSVCISRSVGDCWDQSFKEINPSSGLPKCFYVEWHRPFCSVWFVQLLAILLLAINASFTEKGLQGKKNCPYKTWANFRQDCKIIGSVGRTQNC